MAAAPYGIDSNPIKDMIAIYAPTEEKGKTIIVGYVNKNHVADIGELRLFSTNSSGVVQSYVWIKNTGIIELAGNTDNAVRYAALNTALTAHNNAVQAELIKIQTAITGLGGAYVNIPVTINISSAKINEIKTP
jgi:hypothetical protein